MNDTTHTTTGPRFLIAGYGSEGALAMNLFAHTEPLLSEQRNNHTTYLTLGETSNTKVQPEQLDGIDMVFILGSDDDTSAPPSALKLATLCNEKNIHCFTMLSFSDPAGAMDVATKSLCELSNNVLLLPFNRPVDNLVSCNMLKAAVATIIDPLVTQGLVGVDLQDMQHLLSLGKQTCFSLSFAQGEGRAIEATKNTIGRLPVFREAVAIIGNITCETDFGLEEYDKITDEIHTAAGSNCVVAMITTPHIANKEEILLTLMCVMK
jgi:cell division GTPase FtsZ